MLAVILLVLSLAAAPQPATAYDFFSGANCSTNTGATACNSQPDTSGGKLVNPLNDTLARITTIVAFAAGAAAVIIIIISALKLITSGSNISTGSRTDTDVEDARRSLAGAVIGLAVIVLARTLIMYVINKL
ncbi:MAG TPA: hypothetical protein VNG32_04555 [Candidatus Dormibacteraeota bacterium]|nr:hypothetical protein [Candidatus Dormibacteraeota bacterium]